MKPWMIYLPTGLKERLRAFAFDRRTSQADVVRKALETYLNRVDRPSEKVNGKVS